MANAIDTSQTWSLIKLHAVIFTIFTALYWLMDFKKHFGTDPKDILYFSATVHSTVGFGDITPKTQAAKTVVTLHMVLSFIATLLVLEQV
jgi:uncharacterized membrane protein